MANYATSALKLSDTYVNTLPYNTCSTAAATAAKTVSAGDFSLETGASVMVKFANTNSASNPTLNVSDTGAKAIYYKGAAITASYLKANYTYTFVYNGTQWDLVGEINTDSGGDIKGVTAGNGLTGGGTSGTPTLAVGAGNGIEVAADAVSAKAGTGITVDSTGINVSWSTTTPKTNGTAAVGSETNVARGDHVHPLQTTVSGNAGTATKFESSQSVALTGDVTGSASSQAGWSVATTLANSGVTAGSYGPTDNASPAHSGTFSVPEITVDAKGRVTSASTKTITLPADNNTDTKVQQNAVITTAGEYPVILAYSTSTSKVTNAVNKASEFTYNPSTQILTVPKIASALTGNADTATKLATARKINNVSFDGSSDITVYSPNELPVISKSISSAGWYRVASCEAIGTIQTLEWNLSRHYNATNNESYQLLFAYAHMTCNFTQINSKVNTSGITKVRLVKATTNTHKTTAYLEFYYSLSKTNPVYSYIRGNADTTVGWSNVDFTEGSIPSGYDAIEFELSSNPIKASSIEGSLVGNADTATKATQDGSGNVITSTYAKLASPTLTGTPKAPTASAGTNTTQIATTAFVTTAISNAITTALNTAV